MAATVLTSCGGAGGSAVAEGGIGGTGVSMGRVTQVGSVYVNGIQYNTDTATFTVDGVANPTLSDISVGMVVRVTGSSDPTAGTGVADTVEYDSLLTGPVDCAFDPIDCPNQLSAMGQTVNINADTVYEDNTGGSRPLIEDLVIGDVIEVSGFTDGETGILATRIEVETSGQNKVTGIVMPVDTTSFMIERLTINLLGTTLSLPSAGSYVEVTGNNPPNPTTLEFTPSSIEILGSGDGTVADDGEEVEIEGQITVGFDGGTNRFSLNSQIVEVLPGTEFEPGSLTSSDLTAGRIIEVEGVMNGTILLAEEIEIEASASEKSEIAGQLGVGNVDLAASTVTLLDQVIQIDNATILENDLGGSSTFALADLISSDYLEATVYDNNGVLTASKLERETLPREALNESFVSERFLSLASKLP
ncbi:MAG: hypothetical protein KZQ65_00690 [Candidatus Thiodiazotropha sp. (ex Gloverina cf. vestifex)]|nr:hypothetical protein [Candidatus Thiodiazotropha sp. (ex Gloverina cf. vestifex)]